MEQNKNGISARIVADSLNSATKDRITTFLLTMPRIVLAEFNTHRMLSRNSASSRAIPFAKMVKTVEESPFIPMKWMKDHKGMQGTEYFSPETTAKEAWIEIDRAWGYEDNAGMSATDILRLRWLDARDYAVDAAKGLNLLGVSKQMCNRLLEPFMYHTVIVTATEWENFFALRADPAAEIHIQDLAFKMLEAYNNSTPKILEPGEWHIPFGDNIDIDKVFDDLNGTESFDNLYNSPTMTLVKIATARCAGVSYTVVGEDGKEEDYTKLIARHDKLATSGHWSPFEHCARTMTLKETLGYQHSTVSLENPDKIGNFETGWSGNFRGFIQYRKFFADENKKDERIRKPFENSK